MYSVPLMLRLLAFSILGVYCEEELQQNAVAGEPYVNCAADAIYVKLKTNFTFAGHVSVKFAPNRYCYQVLVTNNQIEVLIPHQECSVSRTRSLSPAGVFMETSLVVSFHPDFTTADDRIFALKCFHVQKSKGLEVGTSHGPEGSADAPDCSYSILHSPGGAPAGVVQLGESVYHEWSCKNTKNSCLLVKNCALVAGDERHAIIAGDGCSKDVRLLPNLQYVNQSYVAQNVSVFGVASASVVYFECELLLLPSAGGHCQTPICGEDDFKVQKRHVEQSTDPALEVRSQRIEISSLPRNLAVVPDPETTPRRREVDSQKKEEEESGDSCVPMSILSIVGAVVVTMLALSALIVSVTVLRRYRHYNMAQSAS